MNITLVADLHGEFPTLKGGDLLLLAGDYTTNDTIPAWKNFFDWLVAQPYRKKIYIAGNHDNFLTKCHPHDKDFEELYDDPSLIYLQDSGYTFEGFNIWGTPWSLWFKGINPHCKAFTGTERKLEKHFAKIPLNTDILISHSPPNGILDAVNHYPDPTTIYTGSIYLRNISMDIAPKLHVFGHIHEHGGQIIDTTLTKYVNASIMDENYDAVHEPVYLTL